MFMLMYVILRVVYLQELFWLQPNSHCCFLFVTTEVLQKCFGGARWKGVTVICLFLSASSEKYRQFLQEVGLFVF